MSSNLINYLKEQENSYMKKKKIIIGTVVLLFLMCLVPIEHYYGDNIYGALMYGEYDVKK